MDATVPGVPAAADERQGERAHYDAVFPNIAWTARIGEVVRRSLDRRMRSAFARLPGFGGLRSPLDAPRRQPLRSNSRAMARWYHQPYGTADKPQSLAEVPWDYVEANQRDIPFLGLREHWYPALQSHELANNEPKAVLLLGDNLVLFRDRDGQPRTLENRCPHRNALLTLGQVGVWDAGTITCRYHGMTFDGDGNCVAFLADGADSPACSRVKARAYPTVEHADIIWIYMGELAPKPLLEALPNARQVLGSGGITVVQRRELPYSYLNQLDNTVDITHVGCLHRTCLLFGDQKPGGGIGFEELPHGGIRAFLRERGGHAGSKSIDKIEWYLPNLVYHNEEMLAGNLNGGWFWFVPRDVGHFAAWQIATVNTRKTGRIKGRLLARLVRATVGSELPGTACFIGGDAPMQASQGRVVRWDDERLARIDRATVKVRQMLKDAHRAEIAAREARGRPGLPHILARPKPNG